MRRRLLHGLVLLLALVAVAQLVPYGREHSNPPIAVEPRWDAPSTRALAARACFDCHSNETSWPWYSYVAPMSWLLERHVEDGREHLNFSEWDRPQRHAREASEEVREGNMPLLSYRLLHAHARLSDAERAELARGLERTFGPAPAGGQESDEGEAGERESEEGEAHEH